MASTSTSDASTTSFAAVLATAALTLGVFMAAAVAASRASGAPLGRALVKTSSFIVAAAWIALVPAALIATGGPPARGALLHAAAAQLVHYAAEVVALALSRADDQRIGHHLVGAVFAAAAFQVSAATYEEYKRFFWGFAVVVQGGSVFTKAVQLRRALAPAAARKDALEYALVHANAALNAVTYPCELYLLAVGLRYPSAAYRAALIAQATYDAFWLRRLVTSVRRYRLAARKAAMAA